MVYQKKVRKKNEKKIFSYIFYRDEFSVAEIADYFNVSFPTAKSIVEKYLESGIIEESDKETGKAGRRAQKYIVDANSVYSIGVKVELDRMVIILIDLKGKILKKFSYHEVLVGNEEIVESLIVKLEEFLEDIEDEIIGRIIGIGVSIPGIVDKQNKVLKIGTNFRIKNKSLAEIEKKIGKKLYIENEADAGAVAEKILGAGVDKANFSFLSIGTGVGLGTYNMGRLYRGGNGMAGEIGHMSIQVEGRRCNCGGRGCWEQYSSDIALFNDFKEHFKEIGAYSDIFKKQYIESPEGKEILRKYIQYLGIGIKNLLMINNPEKIIVGGELTKNREVIEDELKKVIFDNNIFYSDDTLLEFSRFNENSNLIGAALLPLIEELF